MGRGRGGNSFNNFGRGVAVTNNGTQLPASQFKVMKAGAISIDDMKHKDMRKELVQAISRFAGKFNLQERTIKLAPMSGAYGVTYIGEDGSRGVYLSLDAFDRKKKDVVESYAKSNYARRHGFKNTTRNPAQHTMTHELAHSIWTSNYNTPKHKAAGAEIKALYKKFKNDNSSSRKKNYGSYGSSSADEFWAEVVTKAVHGDNDYYTRKALKIAKRHNL